MINKIILVAFSALFLSFSANSQRVAVVDVNGILDNLTDYQSAQNEVDMISAKWRQEIAQEYDKIKSMYNKFQAEQVLLSDEVRRQREDEIVNKEKSIREMQKQRFGPEGALFKRRQALVQPIQDKVYSTIEDYAKSREFDFILDKGSSAGLLFVNSSYDKTEDIIDRVN